MTTPHKHQALINAWAAGAQIQWRINDRDVWEDTAQPVWYPNHQYRVKSPHQTLVDAHEAGEIIEVEGGSGAYWTVVFEPEWRPGSIYRISPRSAELKPMIEAHKAGKQIQRKAGHDWVDTVPTWTSIFEYRIKDKFADLKKAFSEGKLIEAFDANLEQFCVNLRPTWDESVEYRLCPRQDELKPVIEAHLKGKQIEFREGGYDDWFECAGSPLWQASHDYRVKTHWQKELDAWRAGKKIECRRTDRADTWDVQIPANLDYYLLNPQGSLEYRIFDEYRDLKEAEARGEVIEQARNINGLWYAQTSPCTWVDQVSHYRVSPRSETLRPIIDAWKAGKQIQMPLDEAATKWRDMDTTPMFDSGSRYRIKPEALKSRRYVWANPGGRPQVGICDPNNHHKVPASSFVRWIDDDWVETEV